MKSGLHMGIDIGTSGVRASLFDTDGRQVGFFHKEYPCICDQPGMMELDPATVFDSTLLVVKVCLENSGIGANSVESICMSTQMHSFMAIDRDGNPLTRVMTWADTRCMAESNFIRDNYDYKGMYQRTGCRVQHPLYPLSKVLWLKKTQKELFNKVYKFISVKGYILSRLYGETVIDITDASTTAYFNIHRQQWDEGILKDILGVGKEKFPEPLDCTHIFRHMKNEYAAAMGVNPETPVVIGSGDGILANVGCGVFDDTAMTSTVGTSGAMRISVNKPLLDPLQRTWCYSFTRDTWVAGGAINNGGISLRWLRDEFKQQFEADASELGIKSLYELFDIYAAEIKPGCDGLIFLPYLTGERSPDWNGAAKGTIHGLTLSHGRKHFVRAAMEGVMFRMFSVFEVITQISDNIKRIMANGGYVNSDVWMQIQADIFNKEIMVAGIGEASVFGAAYVGMAATGAIKDLKTPLPGMQSSKVIKPVKENHEVYVKVYKQAMNIYNKLKAEEE